MAQETARTAGSGCERLRASKLRVAEFVRIRGCFAGASDHRRGPGRDGGEERGKDADGIVYGVSTIRSGISPRW